MLTKKERVPLVSIGMPVFNGEPYIRQAVDSLLEQDFGNFELIISDNASTDQTQNICEDYARKDSRVKFYRQSINGGPLDNFNRVLESARGKFFMWAAADDLWEPSYISSLLQLLKENPSASLAFSAFDNVDEDGVSIKTYPSIFRLPSIRRFQRLRNFMFQEECLGKANLIYGLMPTSVIKSVGAFKPSDREVWGADMLLVFRLLIAGNMVLIEKTLFHKRLSPQTIVSSTEQGFVSGNRRLSGIRSAIQSWRGYFLGYAEAIASSSSLSTQDKIGLSAALFLRKTQVYLRKISVSLVKTFISRPIKIIKSLIPSRRPQS